MKFLPQRRTYLIMLACSTILTSGTLANDFVISTATSVMNGGAGNTIDGDDSLTVQAGGSITVTSGDAIYGFSDKNVIFNAGALTVSGNQHGILILGNENSITNSGTIDVDNGTDIFVSGNNNVISNTGELTTTNSSGVSVFFGGTGNIFSNTGMINTSGTNSIGAFGGFFSTVENSGTINTTGNASAAIRLNGNNTVSNSGDMTTTGDASHGINFFGANNEVSNSGQISTSGAGSIGIIGGLAGRIDNSGSILTSGLNSNGVELSSGNADPSQPDLINTGIIHTTGAGAVGIFADTDNVISHSGYLVSEQSNSMELLNDQELSLLAPAYIGGNMDLGEDTVVHVSTGRSHSNLWNFADHGGNFSIDFNGPVPWAWDAANEQFATLDPTALSAQPDLLADNVGILSDLVRMSRGGASANNLVAADLAVVQYNELIRVEEVAPPEPVRQYDGEWWLNGYGSFAEYRANDIYNDYTHINGGIAAGASFQLDENWAAGGFLGYQISHLNVNSRWVTSQTILAQGLVGGIFGDFENDGFFAEFALFGGFLGNSSDRFVNDNLMPPLGADHAIASYNSFFLAPELRLGFDLETGGDWTLSPSATARFSSQWVDGYTETGSNANAIVGAQVVQVFEGKLELAAKRSLDGGALTLRGGVDYRQSLGAATQDIVLLGQTLALPMNNAGTFGAYIGADFNYNLSDEMTLDLSAKGTLRESGYAVSGSVGISGLF